VDQSRRGLNAGVTPILVTDRLALREMALGDVDFVAAMLADPEVMRFYPRCYSRDEAHAWVRRQMERYARYGHGLWLVLDRRGGEPVGQVGLTIQDVDGAEEPEVGYLIHRPFWRRGFATEAALATRDYAFNTLGKTRVISLIRPENVPSQGVAAKMGMTVEKPTTHAGLTHLVFGVSRPRLA
jgi:ribosomal-protein-alanine N-acetyltransferase